MSNTLVDSLKDCIDSVLGVRDSIGAVKSPVYLVTRKWSGAAPGDGKFTDTEERILPSPYVVSLDKNVRLLEAGVAHLGDIEVRHLSKNKYPDKAKLDSTSPNRKTEKLYRVGTDLYQVIQVVENYVYWNVRLRKLTDQTR